MTRKTPYYILAALAAAYLVCNFWKFPQFYLAADEGIYLRDAFLLSRGTLFGGAAAEALPGWSLKYPLGNALLIAPWLKAGFRYVFFGNVLMLVLCTALAAALFRRMGISPSYAALVLLNPSMVLFSRTVMSELPSCLVLLAGVLFYVKGENKPLYVFWSFFLFGAACLIKYANALYLPVFGAAYAVRCLRGGRPSRMFLMCGALAGPAVLALQNHHFLGAWYNTGYGDVLRRFDLSHAGRNALEYFTALNINYPGMLLVCFLYRWKYRAEFTGVILLFFVTQSMYRFGLQGDDLAQKSVLGLRFMLPVMPVMILMYSHTLQKWIYRIPHSTVVAGVVIAFLLAGDTALCVRHYEETLDAEDISEKIYFFTPPGSALICNREAGEHVNPVLGDRVRMSPEELREAYASVGPHSRAYVVYCFDRVRLNMTPAGFGRDQIRERDKLKKLKKEFTLRPVVRHMRGRKDLELYSVEPPS